MESPQIAKVLDQSPILSPGVTSEQETRVRHDFLFEWFQNFHGAHHVLKSIYKFSKNDCLFNERYLAMLMHLAVPNEFECIIRLDSGENFDELSEQDIRKRWGESYETLDCRTLNFQFLASLKQFFKEKSLDFSPMLKQIFKAIERKEKNTELVLYETSFWQLIQMVFAGFYLESNPGCDNFFIRNFFEVEIKVDILLLRMVLDIVSKCLKQVEPCDEAFENSAFLNSS